MFWHFNSIEKVKRTLSRQIFNIRIESKLPTLKAFSDTSKVSISVKRCSFETCSKRIIHPFFRSFFVCRWQMKRKTGGKKYLKNIKFGSPVLLKKLTKWVNKHYQVAGVFIFQLEFSHKRFILKWIDSLPLIEYLYAFRNLRQTMAPSIQDTDS